MGSQYKVSELVITASHLSLPLLIIQKMSEKMAPGVPWVKSFQTQHDRRDTRDFTVVRQYGSDSTRSEVSEKDEKKIELKSFAPGTVREFGGFLVGFELDPFTRENFSLVNTLTEMTAVVPVL